METNLEQFIAACKLAVQKPDAQSLVVKELGRAVKSPAIRDAVQKQIGITELIDTAVHRSDDLTVLALAIPPGFYAGPHNHNIWSVVGVVEGQEDNEFYERSKDGLHQIGQKSVKAPDVLSNTVDAIHAIRNPLDTPLLAVHVYGGDLFATDRSTWDPETKEEIPFDWRKTAAN